MPIPVTLTPVEVHINADRRLVCKYLTAVGTPGPTGEVAARVLEEDETRKLVEFNSEVTGILGRKRRVRTVEWVTLDEPSSIAFQGVSGPLPLLNDLIELEEHGGCTVLRYHSTIGAHGWWLGWPLAKWYAKPIVAKHMRDHTAEIKESIEARARESRAFPQVACEHNLSPDLVPVQEGL